MTKTEGAFAAFRTTAPEEAQSFGETLLAGGFAAVRRFLDDFRTFLQHYDESEQEEAERLLRQGRAALPNPGKTSPSWARIWEEYEAIAGYKREIFRSIEPAQRGGEWQVLLDNPYTNGQIAVYPGLTFLEAAYMYAYFRTGLEKNEFIRMQRIETVLSASGASEGAIDQS